MPGRITTRTSTASQLSRKSSVQTLSTRASAATRPIIDAPDEGPSTPLRVRISAIFADAQRATGGHRKLVIKLRKIQEACCYEPTKEGKEGVGGWGEDDFNMEISRCVIRLMGVRKSEIVGDRIVRFWGMFLRHASELGTTLRQW